ncbi:MAG: hypothetical protein J0M18_14150 [Ignavibacteria bacterium]|nr:hypothetical protein [Ignavibacteria bacterium]
MRTLANLIFLLIFCSFLAGCPIIRGAGNAIEATGEGVGHAVEGTGDAIGQTGRELTD